MKKFSFILLLASSLCAPSWAMQTGEGARIRLRASMSLTPEDQHQLLQDFHKRIVQPALDSQNARNKLDLTGKSPKTWDPELKKTLALKPYRRTCVDRGRDFLSFITRGSISASNSPDFDVFCTLSSLNLTRTNLSTDAVTRNFGHIVRHAPGIEVLNLSHNDITDEWLRYVCASDAFRKLSLRELNLSHNGIDKTALPTLMTFPDLEKFDLSYNEVSECTVRRLRKFFLSRLAPKQLKTFSLNNSPGTQYCPNLGAELVERHSQRWSPKNPMRTPSSSSLSIQ